VWSLAVFGGGNVRFTVFDVGQNQFFISSPSFVHNDLWHRVVAWYDSSDDTVNIQVDNGAPLSAAGPAVLDTVASPSVVMDELGGSGFGPCGLDEVGVWNRILTTAERTELWNNGTGLVLETGACLASNELAITLARAGMLRAGAGRAGFAPLEDLVDTDVKTYEWTSRPQPGKQPPLNSVIPTWTTTRR